jgi:hypothetical protein
MDRARFQDPRERDETDPMQDMWHRGTLHMRSIQSQQRGIETQSAEGTMVIGTLMPRLLGIL